MSPVRYDLDLYIPEDGILHSLYHEKLKFYIFDILSEIISDVFQIRI
jgi:hypothetical protein